MLLKKYYRPRKTRVWEDICQRKASPVSHTIGQNQIIQVILNDQSCNM